MCFSPAFSVSSSNEGTPQGEAAKQIPDDFRQKYTYVEWRAMAGMRDRLIHGYFGVDYDIVWDVVTAKVPVLQREVGQILHQESAQG